MFFCDVNNPFDSVHSFVISLSKLFFKKKCFVGKGNKVLRYCSTNIFV